MSCAVKYLRYAEEDFLNLLLHNREDHLQHNFVLLQRLWPTAASKGVRLSIGRLFRNNRDWQADNFWYKILLRYAGIRRGFSSIV